MQRISNKSRDILYGNASDEIMTARMNSEKLNISDTYIKDEIDKIMFELHYSVSQKAISYFRERGIINE